MTLFWELHSDLPREGPGSDESTRKALQHPARQLKIGAYHARIDRLAARGAAEHDHVRRGVKEQRDDQLLRPHAQHGFTAGIAFYPECAAGAWVAGYHAAAPLLILAGELDDWTPSAPCQRLADWTQKQGQPVSIKIYPGALHSFDSYAPITRVPEARQGRGAMIGGNPDAREDSIREVEVFFGRYLKDSGW